MKTLFHSITLVFCLGLTVLQPATHALEAGAAKADLVPPFPTKMAGYFDRHDTFTGVATPLYARALVCANDEMTLGMVVVDLCFVTRELTDLARAEIEKQTGIPGEHVVISATHTHSGPSGFAGMEYWGSEADPRLTEFLVTQIAQSVSQAHAALVPAQIGFAYGHLDTMSRNRQQNNTTVIDPQVGVLKVQQKDSREMIAVLANFTAHPVILGSENLLLSSEFPGQACRTVEETLGGVAILTQGACGDMTIERNGPPHDEVARVGRAIGAEIIKVSELIRVVDDNTLFSQTQNVDLEPRSVSSPEDALVNIDARTQALADAKTAGKPKRILDDLQREVYAANTTSMLAKMVVETPSILEHAIHPRIQVTRIGPLIAVSMPGEMFVEYQLEMKQRITQDTGQPAIVVGYANDYIGYIITPRAQETGGYEKAISLVSYTSGRTLTEAAMSIVRESMAK